MAEDVNVLSKTERRTKLNQVYYRLLHPDKLAGIPTLATCMTRCSQALSQLHEWYTDVEVASTVPMPRTT